MPKKKSKIIEDEGPKKKTMYTIKLDDAKMDQLANLLEEKAGGLWFPYDVAYSLFAFKGEKVNVVGYQSGKLVVSGKNTEDFVRDILEAQITGDPRLGYDEVHHPEWFTLHHVFCFVSYKMGDFQAYLDEAVGPDDETPDF